MLHNCLKVGLSLADAERITIPEYLALVHHHAQESEEAPAMSESDVLAGFDRMIAMGMADG